MSTNKSSVWSLSVHDHSFSAHDVIVYREYQGLEVGDILEVYHPDAPGSTKLLVNVAEITLQQKGRRDISIKSTLANPFELRNYKDVCVNKVALEDVPLDMLELVFKDQFVTRSDCWRLHQSLIGNCVYSYTAIPFIKMRVRTSELYMNQRLVECGAVTESTKIVYRSQSAKFHIMVQMSCEMWGFDFYGDLYFEKAIMGFLEDLFNMWKSQDMNCYHQVVIVLFSRTYYDAKTLDEVPKSMQSEVLCSPDGRYYKDFYKIIRQSEKQDDLKNVILDLKRSFHGYLNHVGCQPQPSTTADAASQIPKGLGYNSRAAEGNLLEAISLSLNVFEKMYINRNLEETNCTTLIITPSSGVFQVEEDLAQITKNRLIENEVGVDVVCLAEQPLHSVPLLKFTSSSSQERGYTIPQWMNLSYYSRYCKTQLFVPRMQVPQLPSALHNSTLQRSAYTTPSDIDYEDFDNEVFNYTNTAEAETKGSQQLKTSPPYITGHTPGCTSVQSSPEIRHLAASRGPAPPKKKLSLQEAPSIHFLARSVSEDRAVAKPGSFDELKFTMSDEKKQSESGTPNKNSQEFLLVPQQENFKRGTVNPFKPHRMANAITLFKHRWLHAFPMNLKGRVHHLKISMDKNNQTESQGVGSSHGEQGSMSSSDCDMTKVEKSSNASSSSVLLDNQHNIKRGAVSDDWEFTILTSVDWKSLCMPGCLPLTIDYFPDATNLGKLYTINDYTMVIEDDEEQHSADSEKSHIEIGRFDRNAMPPEKKFMEMISQRLDQGFQFVSNPRSILKNRKAGGTQVVFNARNDYVLSLGWLIHHLRLTDASVEVTSYKLAKPERFKPITYRYNLWPHNCETYTQETTTFNYSSADMYNWNSVDRYICESEKECAQYIVGGEDTQLNENMRYFRARFLLLPARKSPLSTDRHTDNDVMLQVEGFLRFLEALNKIRRGSYNKELFSCKNKNARKMSQEKSRRSVTPDKADRRDAKLRSSPVQIDATEQNRDETSCTPSSLANEGGVSINSPLVNIKKAMLKPSSGLHFLSVEDNLRQNTFISAEAVAWMITTVDGVRNQSQAVALGQQLLEEKHIVHASESSRQKFVDGFFLYFITDDKKEGETEKRRFWFGGARKTEDELLTSYNIQWLEVSIDTNNLNWCQTDFLKPELNTKNEKEDKKERRLYKTMEYNLDANEKSGRSEWCTVHYHSHYHPYNIAYAIELNWMVGTGCIIGELIQNLSYKATRCGVHIVPSPTHAFPSSGDQSKRNPFRRSAFIRLNVDCLLKEGQKTLFEEFPEESRPQRMLLFQQTILKRFDFLRDLPRRDYNEKRDKFQYIHSSGSCLVNINDFMLKTNESEPVATPTFKRKHPERMFGRLKRKSTDGEHQECREYGFFWVYNYAVSKKWRSQYTGEVVSTKAFMASFSDFCFNKDDQLVSFWNDAVKASQNGPPKDSTSTCHHGHTHEN